MHIETHAKETTALMSRLFSIVQALTTAANVGEEITADDIKDLENRYQQLHKHLFDYHQ